LVLTFAVAEAKAKGEGVRGGGQEKLKVEDFKKLKIENDWVATQQFI
jgi:hypothetical protein